MVENQKEKIGRLGEERANFYLKNKGYRIIERNHWKPWGELDIVALAQDRTLVFVEVKAIAGQGDITPEDNLTGAKLRKLKRAASLYANSHQKLLNDERGWRIDLVAINLFENGSADIRHYENI